MASAAAAAPGASQFRAAAPSPPATAPRPSALPRACTPPIAFARLDGLYSDPCKYGTAALMLAAAAVTSALLWTTLVMAPSSRVVAVAADSAPAATAVAMLTTSPRRSVYCAVHVLTRAACSAESDSINSAAWCEEGSMSPETDATGGGRVRGVVKGAGAHPTLGTSGDGRVASGSVGGVGQGDGDGVRRVGKPPRGGRGEDVYNGGRAGDGDGGRAGIDVVVVRGGGAAAVKGGCVPTGDWSTPTPRG